MRCPYQKRVISEKFANRVIVNTDFGECLKNECPFYYCTVTIIDANKTMCEVCKRAESKEGKE